MSVKKFRFVSPGIFINEIDRSQLPTEPARMGPVIIGRSEKGPGFEPTLITSFAEFVETFGNPIPGKDGTDVWRNGNYNGPTYAAYAAQAYLKHSNPVTFVRLLGDEHSNPDTWDNSVIGQHSNAGWSTKNLIGSNGGAYGLFVMPSASLGSAATATLTFSDKPNETTTMTLTDTFGNEKVFEVDNDADGASGTNVALDPAANSGAGIATELASEVNGETDLRITATNPSSGVVLLTMDDVGTAGNKAITTDFNNVTGDTTAFTGGANNEQAAATGSLAAVWYLNEGYMWLSGTLRGSEAGQHTTYDEDGEASGGTQPQITVSGSSVLLGQVGNQEWKAIIKDADNNEVIRTSFNFDPDSDSYIRKAFNTNPHLVNSSVYGTATNYWLGETFERSVQDLIPAASSSANQAWGALLQLGSGSYEYSKQRHEHVPSESGWVISQDTSNDTTSFDAADTARAIKLFKFVSRGAGGTWNQNNIKISIEDIKPSKNDKTWPMFTVTIRAIDDTDKSQKILEKFLNCNLNPKSPNYIARKIGDKVTVWDKANKALKVGGDYDLKSKYVRVKTREEVYDRTLIPFGFYGPPKYKGFSFASGSEGGTHGTIIADGNLPNTHHAGTDLQKTFVKAGSSMDSLAIGSRHIKDIFSDAGDDDFSHQGSALNAGEIWTGVSGSFSGSFNFPSLPLRALGSDGQIKDERNAYWGVTTTRRAAGDLRYDPCVTDYLRNLPDQTSRSNVDFHLESSNFNAECQFIFTLDDIRFTNHTALDFQYTSGSRQATTDATKSITAMSGTNFLLTSSDAGINKFTMLMYGGFDGLDITEPEPFNKTRALAYSDTGGPVDEKSSYAYYSVNKAIDIVKDAERVESNLMVIPGVVNQDLTTRLVRVAEERADTMAIIDLEEDYLPFTENTNDSLANQGNIDNAVRIMKDRLIDSSYGAAYYPWVQIKDPFNNRILWSPPSVVALGAMAYSESVKDVWFAPAGFSRGGLTATGAGGLPVVGVNQQLTSKQRDKLYEVNVNPIASFPAEGIVIFGQKTLQLTPSALDRINVRRLLIFLKKEVSRIASTILFEPNLEVTWAAFTAKADSLLNSVKARLGLQDYKLVLDKTTTTPDLVDRNILYAKVYLKPARAIEFIALDFIITRSGASFED